MHLRIVSQFNPNFRDKYYINGIINQVIDIFCFKLRLNNTHISHNFESGEFKRINLAINVNINTFKLNLMRNTLK